MQHGRDALLSPSSIGFFGNSQLIESWPTSAPLRVAPLPPPPPASFSLTTEGQPVTLQSFKIAPDIN